MKNVFKLCLIIFIGTLFTYCDDDNSEDDTNKVNIIVTVSPEEGDAFDTSKFEGMKVYLRNTRTSSVITGELNSSGIALVKGKMGVYDVSIETYDKIDEKNVVYLSLLENLSVVEDNQMIPLTLHTASAETNESNFIFSEIFFNGETNSGRMMHPDQYFVVYNPTNNDLYMDGLSIAITYHLSWQDKLAWYDTYYPNNVPVYGFVTFPGNGSEHLLKAGEQAVVAFTAVDHSIVEGYENAVNLSGADFEIYYGAEANDVDNPSVPNLLVTEEFFFQPRGYCAPLMFKLENGTEDTILKFYKENYKVHKRDVIDKDGNPQVVEDKFIVIPTNMILDGVQTSDVPQDIVTRTIPESIDRGKFLVNGCHRQELAIRKKIQMNGKKTYLDTNNSTEDFILQKGQNSFPVGWREAE